MKKLLIGMVLLGGITAIAYASLNSNRRSDKQATEKKMDKKEKKKECKKRCLFS